MFRSCIVEAAAGPLLTDVIHEVLRLLDFLYPHTAAVLAVNKALREYSHQQPANISLWDGDDIWQLTRGRWLVAAVSEAFQARSCWQTDETPVPPVSKLATAEEPEPE
ncbi:TPA: hypothetical protein ACH3X3_003236 [Trebouxia sp. C0006]